MSATDWFKIANASDYVLFCEYSASYKKHYACAENIAAKIGIYLIDMHV